MATLAERIKAARLNLGLSQAAVARQVGISQPAFRKIEAGETARSHFLPDVLRVLQLADDAAAEVPIVGYVGAGAAAHYYADGQGPFDTVPAPIGSSRNTVAVEIRGESLGPLFSHWLVFFDDVKSPVTDDLIGRLCVVGLKDDRVLIKQIKRSKTRGLYHLLSQTEPPILDVEIAWAAMVKTLTPR